MNSDDADSLRCAPAPPHTEIGHGSWRGTSGFIPIRLIIDAPSTSWLASGGNVMADHRDVMAVKAKRLEATRQHHGRVTAWTNARNRHGRPPRRPSRSARRANNDGKPWRQTRVRKEARRYEPALATPPALIPGAPVDARCHILRRAGSPPGRHDRRTPRGAAVKTCARSRPAALDLTPRGCGRIAGTLVYRRGVAVSEVGATSAGPALSIRAGRRPPTPLDHTVVEGTW
jgi:hypothetical protein